MNDLDAPPTAEEIRALCDAVGGQSAAARLLHVTSRAVRLWVAGDRRAPWMAAELLRRIAAERGVDYQEIP